MLRKKFITGYYNPNLYFFPALKYSAGSANSRTTIDHTNYLSQQNQKNNNYYLQQYDYKIPKKIRL